MTDAASRLAYLTRVDAEKLNRDTKALFDLEMGVTFSAYHAAARKTYEILKETGIPNAEIISFPADAKTACQDKITPDIFDKFSQPHRNFQKSQLLRLIDTCKSLFPENYGMAVKCFLICKWVITI